MGLRRSEVGNVFVKWIMRGGADGTIYVIIKVREWTNESTRRSFGGRSR